MDSEEQVRASLEQKGIELSLNEIRKAGELLRKVASGEVSQETVQRMADGELTEDELEEVAGGIVDPGTIIVLAVMGALAAAGITISALSFLGSW